MGGADIWRTLCGAKWRSVHGHWRLSAYGDNRRTARFCSRTMIDAHVSGQPHGLLDQRLDDLGCGNGLDHFTANEYLALAISRCDAEVGFAGLARTVDHAAHDRDAQRHVKTVQPG